MTPEEREAHIRRIVDSAPLPSPEDVDRLRALLSLGARAPAERTAHTHVPASDVGAGRLTPSGGPTLDEVRSWPATVSVPKAATALGVSKSHLYELIRRGEAPVKLVPLGGRHRVITASLVRLLEGA
ncbi:helix-turn-helix domain-containing protein [Streptomyces sp. NPDC008092]|uniref:helix-turn-helix transcriptional regulator n=1 Tax=Streptomyces sp. NPDC008092 TaxID=3364808 RepID=UPI0036EA42D9